MTPVDAVVFFSVVVGALHCSSRPTVVNSDALENALSVVFSMCSQRCSPLVVLSNAIIINDVFETAPRAAVSKSVTTTPWSLLMKLLTPPLPLHTNR